MNNDDIIKLIKNNHIDVINKITLMSNELKDLKLYFMMLRGSISNDNTNIHNEVDCISHPEFELLRGNLDVFEYNNSDNDNDDNDDNNNNDLDEDFFKLIHTREEFNNHCQNNIEPEPCMSI